MTAKEKAKKLVESIGESISKPHRGGYKYNIEQAKKCALIAVDEILKITWVDSILTVEDFWQEVKKEIELL